MSDVKRPEISIWEVDQAIAAALPEAFNKVIAERDQYKNEAEMWDENCQTLNHELDHLRQDNERLKGEVEAWRKEVEGSASGATFVTIKNLNLEICSWKRCAKENAILADNRLADLQSHKSCLEVARGALREAQVTCESDNHDQAKFALGAIKSVLATINELLQKGSVKS